MTFYMTSAEMESKTINYENIEQVFDPLKGFLKETESHSHSSASDVGRV